MCLDTGLWNVVPQVLVIVWHCYGVCFFLGNNLSFGIIPPWIEKGFPETNALLNILVLAGNLLSSDFH